MNPTSVSLLDRLKAARPDASDWGRLQEIYSPLIERWLGRIPGLGDESADLAQEVLVVVVREIPRFNRQREGSFRAWLRQVTVNKVRNYRRKRHRRRVVGGDQADGFLERLSDANGNLAPRVGPRPRRARRSKAPGARAVGLFADHMGGVSPFRRRRRSSRSSGRGTRPVRERGHSRQVSCSQAVKGGSRRTLGLILFFPDRSDARPTSYLR